MFEGITILGSVNLTEKITLTRSILEQYTPSLLWGALVTIEVTIGSVFVGLIIGLFMGMFRLSRHKIISFPATVYIEFFRGTPLLVQIFWIYFGIAPLIAGKSADPLITGIIVCGINSGAYIAEIVRGGILSIDKGQMEAAKSLGMSESQAMQHIILPQAFKIMIPPLINEFVAMLKDTSLVSVISIQELMLMGKSAVSDTYQPFIVYSAVALIYFAMTLPITRLGIWAERRLKTT
ncbi:MAG: amino acid ABC transporter permease [Acidobacteriota bacterium]